MLFLLFPWLVACSFLMLHGVVVVLVLVLMPAFVVCWMMSRCAAVSARRYRRRRCVPRVIEVMLVVSKLSVAVLCGRILGFFLAGF